MSNDSTYSNCNIIAGNDMLELDARALSRALAEQQVRAEDLMVATLDRIEALNPTYKAIIAIRNRSVLLEEARQCDQRLQRARKTTSSDEADNKPGKLCGIPIAIKDLSNVVGLPTTMGGSPLYRNYYPTVSDPFAKKILDEGAIVIGKTNTPELGVGSHTFNKRWGTTVNPYDPTKSAGGSSGGAAVALATRMLCIADGTDMMGSLRNPAGWNNIYSHRPTAGMIDVMDKDNNGKAIVNPLPYPISTPGPLARNPIDVAFLLDIMSGNKDNFDDNQIQESPIITGTKIGWLGDWGGSLSFEEGILPLCRDALGVLSEQGALVSDLNEAVFPLEELWQSWTTIRSKVISDNFADPDNFAVVPNVLLRPFLWVAPVREEIKWEIRRGRDTTEEDCQDAANIATEWSKRLEELFSNYDVLALPTAQLWPFPAAEQWPKDIAGTTMTTYHKWMEVVMPASLAGLPCTTIPGGFGRNGLPMGIQLIGKRGDDVKLLNLAQAYHRSVDWPNQKRPEL